MKNMFRILAVVVAIFAGIGSAHAQMKIVSGHPDFSVKVTRCAASGKVVVLDMVFTNLSETDVERWGIYVDHVNYTSSVYDSEGNVYERGSLRVKVANLNYSAFIWDIKMISDVPTKVSLRIDGVPEHIESLARVDIGVDIPLFNIKSGKNIIIKNIPIAR